MKESWDFNEIQWDLGTATTLKRHEMTQNVAKCRNVIQIAQLRRAISCASNTRPVKQLFSCLCGWTWFITVRQRNCGKVMFSQVCVCLSVHGDSSCDHYPWCIGPHSTGPHETSDMGPTGPGPLLVTSGGHHWRPVQACSLENTPGYWHLVAKSRMVGKRAVCILLECFLVYLEFSKKN